MVRINPLEARGRQQPSCLSDLMIPHAASIQLGLGFRAVRLAHLGHRKHWAGPKVQEKSPISIATPEGPALWDRHGPSSRIQSPSRRSSEHTVPSAAAHTTGIL